MVDVKEIIELMKAVSVYGLTKFELEQGDTKLFMRKERPSAMTKVCENSAVDQEYNSERMLYTEELISCPLVGTFYSAPSPGAENFVRIGDHVKKGQIVGIVEAMKLMNEIEAECDGIVEKILVNNEDTVEYGQPLFAIRSMA